MKKLLPLLCISISLFAADEPQKNEDIKPSADSKIIACGMWTQVIPVQWQLLQDQDTYWVASRVDIKKTNVFVDLEKNKRWHYAKANVKKTPENKVYEIILSGSEDTLDLLEGSLKNKDGLVKGHVEQSDECKAIAAIYHELARLKVNQEKA